MTIKKLCGKILKGLAAFSLAASICIAFAGFLLYQKLSEGLPDIKTLHNVQYQVPLSIYSKDNLLIAQFGEKKRTPISLDEAPQQLIKAFLAAEDERFFDHPGIDYKGLLRATIQLALTGKKRQGGSTITMQVTRNFLLGREKTYIRKIKEIILALKIEREYSKKQILELYLNQIYMGHRAYGIAAAAQIYYGRPLSALTLAEYAMIAGLPKAPSTYNPITNETRALQRRNYVLRRMLELNHINQQEYDIASKQPSTAKLQYLTPEISAPYLAEMVRQKLVDKYGDDAYTSGFKVYTTVDSSLQKAADQALRNTLHAYDERHGYHSAPLTNVNEVNNFSDVRIIGDTLPAYIVSINKSRATARLQDNTIIEVPWENLKWAQHTVKNSLKSGDIIRVRQLKNNTWALAQVPKVEGAFVSINPINGAIMALSGGFDFFHNKYNRAIQAKRQPGSGFKPIIYTTALEEGYTTASFINDAPIVIEDPSQANDEWRPENYNRRFFGPTSIRTALTHSRNIISIRLLKAIGIEKAVSMALRFGFTQEQLPKTLSLALGSGYASPLQMARAYAVFANGGFLIKPYFIERIESHEGKVIYQATPRIACPSCNSSQELSDTYAPRIISPRINFLMNSLLKDVIQYGTATRAKDLNRQDIAGKTGTTNDQRDAWFNGYSPSIVATAWVGFDNYASLGNFETGGVTALPMWIEFMRTALKNTPEVSFDAPEGIVKAFINPQTGLLAPEGSPTGVWEFFQVEHAPDKSTPAFENLPAEYGLPYEKPIEALF